MAPRVTSDPACDPGLMGLVARLVSSSVFSNPIVLAMAGSGAGVRCWGGRPRQLYMFACVFLGGEGGLREGLHNEVTCSEQTVGWGRFTWEGGLPKSSLYNEDVDVHLNKTHTLNCMTHIAQ